MLHLVDGRMLDASETLAMTIAARAQARGEFVLALGSTRRAVHGVIPMPAGRMTLAASILEQWCARGSESPWFCWAWGVESVSVAAASGIGVVPVLDGLLGTGRAIRRAAHRIVARGLPVIAGSPSVVDGLERAVGCEIPAKIVPLAPLERSPGVQGDDQLEIVVLAEPGGMLRMRGVVNLIGRLHLLGQDVRVRIAGSPVDRGEACVVLAHLGIKDIRVCTLEDLWEHVGPGCIAWMPRGRDDAGGGEAVGPALRAWTQGATLLLPDGHAAESALSGLPGVLDSVDSRIDPAVRKIIAGTDHDADTRADHADRWWTGAEEAFEMFSAHSACAQ